MSIISGDIALYTTANENSAFFVTRAAILKEATRRVRYLLRDPQYQSVAIAGHSLGSVIGYDTINQLRTEARLSGGVRASLDDLSKLVVNLNSQDAFAAEELIKEVKSTMQGASVSMPATPEEIAKLRTFITFGSPLNKVLYFFRTKIKVYETVRRHIIQDLQGFRLLSDINMETPNSETRIMPYQIADKTKPVADMLNWVKALSLCVRGHKM